VWTCGLAAPVYSQERKIYRVQRLSNRPRRNTSELETRWLSPGSRQSLVAAGAGLQERFGEQKTEEFILIRRQIPHGLTTMRIVLPGTSISQVEQLKAHEEGECPKVVVRVSDSTHPYERGTGVRRWLRLGLSVTSGNAEVVYAQGSQVRNSSIGEATSSHQTESVSGKMQLESEVETERNDRQTPGHDATS
jgi:hypothetical protein